MPNIWVTIGCWFWRRGPERVVTEFSPSLTGKRWFSIRVRWVGVSIAPHDAQSGSSFCTGPNSGDLICSNWYASSIVRITCNSGRVVSPSIWNMRHSPKRKSFGITRTRAYPVGNAGGADIIRLTSSPDRSDSVTSEKSAMPRHGR
jgi:hypothetical protein